MAILAIDAGTTGVTCLVVDKNARVLAKGYQEFIQYFPHSGWVEHDLEEIWQAVLQSARSAISQSPEKIECIGITNQRETLAVWRKADGSAPCKAIVWQDRRTEDIVNSFKELGIEELVRVKTGLGLDPYFTSTKFVWIRENEPQIWQQLVSGECVAGTIDAYLISRLTGGELHITDSTNASRTQLMNINTCSWDEELLEIFGVAKTMLPKIVPSLGEVGRTKPGSFLNLNVPISGIAGDQQAALFGQACFEPGEIKCTYGTGAFILLNTGANKVTSKNGLVTTVALQDQNGQVSFALEGSVFVAGAAVQWLRDGLGIISTAAEIESLAKQCDSSEGVVFVPALTGLGAPEWDSSARGTILGITRGTKKAHIARATLEAIALQVKDVVDAMQSDLGKPISSLKVDGGAAENDLLMQLQSDLLQAKVERCAGVEMTGLGAAFLAGIASGFWKSQDEIKNLAPVEKTFQPKISAVDEDRWHRAVEASRGWAI